METLRLRPDRTALFAVIVLALGALPLGASQLWLTPVLFVPLAWGTWVVRARVLAAPVGVEVCNGWVVRRFQWQDVAGFDLPARGRVRLLATDGRSVRLTAMSRNDLPALLAAGEDAARAAASS